MRRRAPVVFAAGLAAVGLIAIGCGDREGPVQSTRVVVADDAGRSDGAPGPAAPLPFVASGGDERQALAAAGAMAPWQAVIGRSELLERRGDSGWVYGRLVGRLDGYRWMVDETEGNGTLGIRVELDHVAVVEDGARVAVAGAWRGTDGGFWVWRASDVKALPAATSALSVVQGHAISEIPRPPKEAVWVSALPESGDVIFRAHTQPAKLGDGWGVADSMKSPVVAVLVLPGERSPYGAQDYTSADEQWALHRGRAYVVSVERVYRPKTPGGLPILYASSAPREIDRRGIPKVTELPTEPPSP